MVSWIKRLFGGAPDGGGAGTDQLEPPVPFSPVGETAGSTMILIPPPPPGAWMPDPIRDRMEWDGGPERWGYRRATGYALGGQLNDEAYALIRLDLAEARSLTPADEPFRLLEILATAAAIAFREGDATSAERLAREVIAIAKASGSDFDADRAAGLVRLGEVQNSRGDRHGALGAYREALSVREASLGADHKHSVALRDYVAGYDVAAAEESREAMVLAQFEHQMANGLSASRDIVREEAFREAYNIAQFDLGGSHPATARACAALAEILDFRGCLQEARKYWFHHADILMLRHGADSPEVTTALGAIAANQRAIADDKDRGESDMRGIMATRADEHLHVWLLGRLTESA